ncbi:MAG: hypothetical protein RLZZ628_2236 [Bacteroidota bacterium]|jgi:hypothetical protein
MTFLHQKLAILGLLWSIATAALYGQAIAGVHSKHPVRTSQHLIARKSTPLFSNKGWTTFADSLGAFSIELPNYPKRKTFKNNSLPPYEYDITGLKAHLFTSEDRAGNAYMIRYHDLPADKEFTDLNAFFKEKLSELWQGEEPNILIFNNLAMNGYTGRYVVYEVQNVKIHVCCWLRGNRVYLLVLQPPTLHSKGEDKAETALVSAEQWFESFQFMPFAPTTFVTQPLKNEKYMVGVPLGTAPIQISESEHPGDYPETRETTWRVTSPQSGISFSIATIRFSPYYAPENEDSLCHRFLRWRFNRIPEQLTMIDTLFQGRKAKSLRFHLDKRGTIYKNIMFRIGNECYELSAQLPHEVSEDSFVKTFCDKFKLLNPSYAENTQQFYTPKTDILLQDLLTDSAKEKAYSILPEYNFKKNDLSKLYNAVMQPYKDDSLGIYATRYLLLDKIVSFSEPQNIDCLKKLFQKDTNAQILQARILTTFFSEALKGQPNASELFANAFFELAKTWNVSTASGIKLANNLLTDIQDAQPKHSNQISILYPRMMQILYDKKAFNGLLNLISIQLLDENKSFMKMVNTFQPIFIRRAQTVSAQIDNLESLQEAIYLTRILGKLPKNDLILNILRKNILSNKIDLAAAATLASIEQKDKLPPTIWKRLSADKSVWYHTLLQLSELNLTQLVPTQYMSQTAVVNTIVFGKMVYEGDNGIPTQIEIMDKQLFKQDGKNLSIYIFKAILFDKDWTTEFYGVCSQPADENLVSIKPDIFKGDALPDHEKDWKPMIWRMLHEN